MENSTLAANETNHFCMVRQGRFLQYGFYGLMDRYYSGFPLTVNLVNEMTAFSCFSNRKAAAKAALRVRGPVRSRLLALISHFFQCQASCTGKAASVVQVRPQDTHPRRKAFTSPAVRG